jgi:hypothetical protein
MLTRTWLRLELQQAELQQAELLQLFIQVGDRLLLLFAMPGMRGCVELKDQAAARHFQQLALPVFGGASTVIAVGNGRCRAFLNLHFNRFTFPTTRHN